MLNWYRALFRREATDPPTITAEPQTLLLWGVDDAYLHRGMAAPSIAHCPNGRLEFVEETTHWLHHERPDRVNELLLEFLES